MNKQFTYKVRRASNGKVLFQKELKGTTIKEARTMFFELVFANIDLKDEILHTHFTDKGIVAFAEEAYLRFSLEY